MNNKKRSYIMFDSTEGYPASKSIYYECGLCGEYIPSRPERSLRCKCGNIIIDADAGRVSVKDGEHFKAFKFK